MRIEQLPIGEDPPRLVNVLVEVPVGGPPVKYEFDKPSGALMVDRFLNTAMHYPANYGFIPHTLSDDGDPVDVLVAGTAAVVPGAVLSARPVGVLKMEDEAGMDEKIIAVPSRKINAYYATIDSYRELPQQLLDRIAHFFDHYKDLEAGKWVKIIGWGDAEEAEAIIEKSIKAATAAKAAE